MKHVVNTQETTTQLLARKTLARLEAVGWSERGSHGPNGEECVGIALSGLGYYEARARFYAAICQRAYPHGNVPSAALASVVRWNDDPTTTWEDVKRVLTEIANDPGET